MRSACEYDYVSKFVVFVVLVQYAAPLVCMEARKRARLSQKELERIAGQLMNVDMDIIRHGIIIMEETERRAWRESPSTIVARVCRN